VSTFPTFKKRQTLNIYQARTLFAQAFRVRYTVNIRSAVHIRSVANMRSVDNMKSVAQPNMAANILTIKFATIWLNVLSITQIIVEKQKFHI
jgi:hypothetical protein